MLDCGASTNGMPSKIMEQLGLKTTHPYGNVCGIDSKKVKVYGLIEYVEVYFYDLPHMNLIMSIAVIDVPNAWVLLLSRSWVASLTLFCRCTTLGNHIPFQKTLLQTLSSSPNLTYRGSIGHSLTFHFNPPRVTVIPPLW